MSPGHQHVLQATFRLVDATLGTTHKHTHTYTHTRNRKPVSMCTQTHTHTHTHTQNKSSHSLHLKTDIFSLLRVSSGRVSSSQTRSGEPRSKLGPLPCEGDTER